MNADQGEQHHHRSAFKATGKGRDKSVRGGGGGGVDEYLSILAEDANIYTDLFHLSPKLEKANSSPSNQRGTQQSNCVLQDLNLTSS